MRDRTLDVSILSLLLFSGALASPAYAQQAGGDSGDGFCTLAATDLLAALDGSWTVDHGAGWAVGGTTQGLASIPFPSPPAGTIIFKYDPLRGVIDARSPDGEVHMLVFPTAEMQEPAANAVVGEPPEGEGSTSSCDWYALPTLTGTNHFYASTVNVENILERRSGFLHTLMLCENQDDPGLDFEKTYPPITEEVCKEYEERLEEELAGPGQEPIRGTEDFEMAMTLVVRFTSTNSASGSLYFEGSMDEAQFRAFTPVTLSR
jgi:hypothetical protein